MARSDSSTSAETAAGSPREGVRGARGGKPRKRRVWLRVLIVVVLVFVLVVGALAAVFAWDRWYRYDDAADIQGRWFPAGSTTAVEIGPDTIALDGDTAYGYALDTHDKTISYKLGPLEGEGRYWFADDRATLVIEDGDYSATDTLLADLGRLFTRLNASIDGHVVALPEGDGVSVFTRTIDPAVVAAKAEAEREAARAEQAKREEEKAAVRAEAEAEGDEAKAEAEGEGTETGEDADDDASDEGVAGTDEEEPREFANESMGIIE